MNDVTTVGNVRFALFVTLASVGLITMAVLVPDPPKLLWFAFCFSWGYVSSDLAGEIARRM